MPPFIPAINYAFAPIAENTGLAGFVPVDASGISGSSTFDNGLSTNQKFNEPNFNTVSTTPSTPGAAQKTPLVDFKFEANRLLGEDNINKYLNGFKNPNSDKNIVFQEFVNKVVGQSFQTPGAINPQMRDIMNKFQEPLAQATNNMIYYPNDHTRVNKFNEILYRLGKEVRPEQADAVPVQNDAVPVKGDKRWWEIFGGRSHKRSRSRSRKQYKKLKRSSRNRRRC